MEFHCSECNTIQDVRTLRNSVCRECITERSRRLFELDTQRKAAIEIQRTRTEIFEVLLDEMPIYEGQLADWRPDNPVLLPGRHYFVCPMCKTSRHIEDDLSYLRKKSSALVLPDNNTVCDECYLDNAKALVLERERQKRLRALKRLQNEA